MIDVNVRSLFKQNFDEDLFLLDEPMYKHTSFKIGGNVDVLFFPREKDEIVRAINICKNNSIDYYIVGNGTNLLVKDGGFKGVIIKTSKYMNKIKEIDDKIIYVESGVFLSKLANYALKKSLSGIEFAYGIPGTLGGAINMNAGAHGGEISDIVLTVDVIDNLGEIREKEKFELDFGYRRSVIEKNKFIILGSKLKFEIKNKEFIKNKMDKCNKERKLKQPLNFPSAGSIFKRPKNNFAGKLIMESGLSGYRIGGAQISEKHCGFIINVGNAKASDVINLMDYINEIVEKKYNIKLEPEIKIIGK